MATPLTPPPDGDTNRGPGLLAEEVILTSIALFTTVFRVGIRVVNRQFGWDDATILGAMACRLISFCFTMLSIAAGNGRHQYYLQLPQIMDIIKWTWGNEVLIFATVCLIKISICLYIFRIKKTGKLRIFLWVIMVGLVVTNGSCIIILLAQCRPLSAFWDPPSGSCWNPNIYNDFIYVSVAYSVVTDLICTALPVIILWNIQISRQIKVAICGLMALGLIASACAAVRAYLSTLADGADLTFNLVSTDEWAFAEADVGIIGANLALGRMMYLFLRQRTNLLGTKQPQGITYPPGSYGPSGASNLEARSNKLYGNGSNAYRSLGSSHNKAFGPSGRSSKLDPYGDDIPLDSQIRRTREVIVAHERGDVSVPQSPAAAARDWHTRFDNREKVGDDAV